VLKTIKLQNFRNFRKKFFKFSPKITVIIGPNASGKTNILEATYLLATGKSFKAHMESEMIAYGEQIARVSGVALTDSKINLEVVLTNGEIRVGDNPLNKKRVRHKRVLANGVPKRLIDFAGNLKVVLFGPWEMDLVTQSPSLRRKFMDNVLSQVDREYRRAAMIYEKGLRQRNRLLLRIRDENVSRGQLMYWDKLLIKHGEYVTGKREKLISFINNHESRFSINNYQLEYDKSVISEGRLKDYEEEEVAAGVTLVGPHRDDIVFKVKSQNSLRAGALSEPEAEVKSIERELAKYGSRGEARMAVLWLKLQELAYVESVTREKPTLLLDDIFSELDHEHREVVMEASCGQQTVITTADPHFIKNLKTDSIIELNHK
jgi:DNA replication and repair protein RecF